MAGLEVLYTCVSGSISCPQDAVVCFVHWEIIKSGYKCVGSGDEPSSSDKRSELLPADWNSNKELYTLRYQSNDGKSHFLLKAITVDSTLIFNLMNPSTQQVVDLTLNVSEHVDADQLHIFDSVFKDLGGLSEKVNSQLLPSQERQTGREGAEGSRQHTREVEGEEERRQGEDSDPLRIPQRHPHVDARPRWPGHRDHPFAVGGEDLDPFGYRPGGGMIMDHWSPGGHRPRFNPSSGIPDILPPGAVPPGARFDPFGPPGHTRPRPDPDHLPPPGYDDMFM